jgi:hypothetical protein
MQNGRHDARKWVGGEEQGKERVGNENKEQLSIVSVSCP